MSRHVVVGGKPIAMLGSLNPLSPASIGELVSNAVVVPTFDQSVFDLQLALAAFRLEYALSPDNARDLEKGGADLSSYGASDVTGKLDQKTIRMAVHVAQLLGGEPGVIVQSYFARGDAMSEAAYRAIAPALHAHLLQVWGLSPETLERVRSSVGWKGTAKLAAAVVVGGGLFALAVKKLRKYF